MAIIIRDNVGFNIGGDLIRVNVPYDIDLTISGNSGTDVAGDIVNLKDSVNTESLSAFVNEASKHFHELTPEQQQSFEAAITQLKQNDKAQNQSALGYLYDLSVAVPGSAIASAILSFLGMG